MQGLGSGVFVDLGNTKTVKGSNFREPAGRCPVMGKAIALHQPTTDASIWPNDYLARVPLKNSPQDKVPLGGGFAMWQMKTNQISPMTVPELKAMADKLRAKKEPNSPASKKLAEVVDDHGLCAWWAWVTFATDKSTDSNLDLKYRYPFVWDSAKKECTLLAIAMQQLEGDGKYCSHGDSEKKLTWYCFDPIKASDSVSYNSAYIRLDHATACPEKPIFGAHFGSWDGNSCSRMEPRRSVNVSSPAACAKALFLESSSDSPTQYTSAPSNEKMKQDSDVSVPTLWPVGAFEKDQPKSGGVGINYANWFTDGTCEMYDTVPSCFIQAPHQYAFTSLGTSEPETAERPPCTPANEGWQIGISCECGDSRVPWTCTNGQWTGGDDACECAFQSIGRQNYKKQQPLMLLLQHELLLLLLLMLLMLLLLLLLRAAESNSSFALGIGLGVGIPIALVGAYFLYRRSSQGGRPASKPEERKSLLSSDGEQEGEEFAKGKQRHKQSDLAQEAEPSFWGEVEQDQTNVVLDSGAKDAYY
ncbi:hypothetical protein Efla_001318 [Eimeria flavescens]